MNSMWMKLNYYISMDFNLVINFLFVLGNSLSPCSLFDSSSSSTETQTTQVTSVKTTRKRNFRVEVWELKPKCDKLEQKVENFSQELVKKYWYINDVVTIKCVNGC